MHHTIYNEDEPHWLKQYRERNHAIVKQLPLQKSKYSNIPAIAQLVEQSPASRPLFPASLKKQGIQVLSWPEAIREIPRELQAVLEQENPATTQWDASVNERFVTGFVAIIDQSVSKPIISIALDFPVNSLAKLVWIVRENAPSFSVVESVSGNGLRLQETIWLGAGCAAHWLSSWGLSGVGLVARQSIVGKDASLWLGNQWLSGDLVRAQLVNNLLGTGSRVLESDWSLGMGKERLDVFSLALHKAASSYSRSVFKSVLTQSSGSVLDGMIKITPQGQQSNAFLEAYGMELSPTASCNLIPGLEIEADDVKATHSASVSHVDEEALFYLESRGLDKSNATELLVMGFLESLLEPWTEAVRAPVLKQLEEKWTLVSKEVDT